MTTNSFIQIAVPAEDVQAVYAFLTDRDRARENGFLPEQLESIAQRSQMKAAAWDRENLTTLAASNAVSVGILAKIMDVLATDPDGSGRYDRTRLLSLINESADVPEGSFRVAFTKWSKHFEAQYGFATWPIIGQERSGEPVLYWMTDEIRDIWADIRGL